MVERRITPVRHQDAPVSVLSVERAMRSPGQVWPPGFTVPEPAEPTTPANLGAELRQSAQLARAVAVVPDEAPAVLTALGVGRAPKGSPWYPKSARTGRSSSFAGTRGAGGAWTRPSTVTSQGALFVTGAAAQAGGMSLASSATLQPATQFGISVWLRPYGTTFVSRATLVNKGLTGVGLAGWNVAYGAVSDSIEVDLGDSADSMTNVNRVAWTGTGFSGAEQVHHLYVQFDMGQPTPADRVRLYRNGVELTATKAVFGTLPTTLRDGGTEPLRLGERGPAYTDDFVGHMAHLALYPGAVLTPAHVVELYNAGVPPDPSALATAPAPTAYYPLRGSTAAAVGGLGAGTLSGVAVMSGLVI